MRGGISSHVKPKSGGIGTYIRVQAAVRHLRQRDNHEDLLEGTFDRARGFLSALRIHASFKTMLRIEIAGREIRGGDLSCLDMYMLLLPSLASCIGNILSFPSSPLPTSSL
jgi:hypothetical protein